MQWKLVYQEYNPWPWGYQSSVFYDRVEFVLQDEVTVEELIERARQVGHGLGLLALRATLWMPAGVEKSSRWLADVVLTSNPAVYPLGVASEAWQEQFVGNIIDGLGIRAVSKWPYEEAIEKFMEALPAFFMLGVMFIVMQMMR